MGAHSARPVLERQLSVHICDGHTHVMLAHLDPGTRRLVFADLSREPLGGKDPMIAMYEALAAAAGLLASELRGGQLPLF